MNTICALIAGLVFGLGLILAGMANPEKVLGFLDLAGSWDPSLALVMGGAIPISGLAFWLAKKRKSSFCGHAIQLPSTRNLDRSLVVGSLLFGAGWGLAGICPGPALVLLGTGSFKAVIFVVAMLVGMILFEVMQKNRIKP